MIPNSVLNARAFDIRVILVLGLVLRVLWALWIDVVPVSDSDAYDIFARNMVTHGVYGFTPDQPGAFWAVGTPAIYAASYLVFGFGDLAVVVVNLISSMLALWFIYRLGQIWFSDQAGRLAALLFALWPVTIQFTTVIASEIHFMAAMCAALYFWEKAHRGPLWGWLLISGLCFAAAVYIRPIAQLIPIVLVILSVVSRDRSFLKSVLQAAVVLALIFAALAPWSARNERVFGTHVTLSTNFGPNFWMGNHRGTTGGYAPMPEWTNSLSEVERAERLKQEAFDYVRAEPGAFVLRTLVKAIKLHNRETIGVAWNKQEIERRIGSAGATGLKLVSSAYWLAMLGMALVAPFYLSWKGHAALGWFTPPFILSAYLVAVHAVIVVNDRYHMPEIPLIALLAAAFLAVPSLRRSPTDI